MKQGTRDPRSTRERRRPDRGEQDYKRVLGGLLVQDRDLDVEDREGMEFVCGTPTEEQWGDLLFAWRVCKHVDLERDRAGEGAADRRHRRRASSRASTLCGSRSRRRASTGTT